MEKLCTLSLIRVLVVEDFAPFRQFVCLTLKNVLNLQVVGEAADGLDAVHKAETLKPDWIVLDIGLPKMNGIEAARQLRELVPESRIIFLSQESSPDVVEAALALGAHGYVTKVMTGVELVAAVNSVVSGQRFVGRASVGGNSIV
jgi:DNA-binding NarL/FixJ family response regulator